MGSVRRRVKKDGTPGNWVACWRDDNGKSQEATFKRKVDAERHLLTVEGDKAAGQYVKPNAGNITVSEYGIEWLGQQTHLKPSSRINVETMWRRIDAYWGSDQLKNITYERLQKWVSEMSTGLSASRTRQTFHCFRSILEDAVKARRLPRNPADGVKLPKLMLVERKYLTHEEVRALADAAGVRGVVILTLAYGGFRWGEMAALQVKHFNTKTGVVTVERNVVDINGVMTLTTPKTHERRSVPLPRFVADTVTDAVKGLDKDDLIFSSSNGEYLRNQNARRDWWNAAAKKAGLEGVTPHSLRHTAVSLMVAAGADVLSVSRMLGHASASTTLDRYGHLWQSSLNDVAERLNKAAVGISLGSNTVESPADHPATL